MANLGRLLSEGSIILLVIGLEYFTIRPLIGDNLGWGLILLTGIILIVDVLKNIL
jgi:hypothetical protein